MSSLKPMLSLKPTLRISQALELRQSLECVLCQSLKIVQKLCLALELYIKREHQLTALYRKALEEGRIKLYEKHGLKFEYALVSEKEVPKEILTSCGHAFSHCLFNGFEALIFGKRYAISRGSWLLFVVYDIYYPQMPDSFIEYAAVHERAEQATLGDHNVASKLEFAVAAKEGRLKRYIYWLEENCPVKLADVFNYQVHLDLPDDEEFRRDLEDSRSCKINAAILRMIENFQWPYFALRKLNSYKRINERIMEIISQVLSAMDYFVRDGASPLGEIIPEVRKRVRAALRRIIDDRLEKFANPASIEPAWRTLLIKIGDQFARRLSSFKQANPNYLGEFLKAGVEEGFPRDGVLSLSFSEALKAAAKPLV